MKWTKEWKAAVYWAFKAECGLVKPLDQSTVTITIYANKPYDDDNAYASMKPVIDGLKRLAIVNDDPAHCTIIVQSVKVKHREGERVMIDIQERVY